MCFAVFVKVFHLTGEFFTQKEMLPLLLKGCKFWPFIGTYSQWAVRVLLCDMGHPFIWSSLRTRDTHICCWAFGSGIFTICFNDVCLLRLNPDLPLARQINTLPTEILLPNENFLTALLIIGFYWSQWKYIYFPWSFYI